MGPSRLNCIEYARGRFSRLPEPVTRREGMRKTGSALKKSASSVCPLAEAIGTSKSGSTEISASRRDVPISRLGLARHSKQGMSKSGSSRKSRRGSSAMLSWKVLHERIWLGKKAEIGDLSEAL